MLVEFVIMKLEIFEFFGLEISGRMWKLHKVKRVEVQWPLKRNSCVVLAGGRDPEELIGPKHSSWWCDFQQARVTLTWDVCAQLNLALCPWLFCICGVFGHFSPDSAGFLYLLEGQFYLDDRLQGLGSGFPMQYCIHELRLWKQKLFSSCVNLNILRNFSKISLTHL